MQSRVVRIHISRIITVLFIPHIGQSESEENSKQLVCLRALLAHSVKSMKTEFHKSFMEQ